jgi:3-oxoacyl-[acyl-carrier protein] reductase
MKLAEKVAIVTGAAQGIGRAIALRLAKEGIFVVVTDINLEKLRESEKEVKKLGECLSLKVDVSCPDEVNKTVDKVIKKLGRVDILVNNAGITARGSIEKVDDETLDRILAVNFKGTFYCCRTVVPVMKRQNYGKIVNISSITGKQGDNTTVPCYGASKGAVATLTKSLARQLGPFGINVNAVAPHAIDTPMMKYWDEKKRREASESLPVRRLGTPEDVAAAVAFLASDEAAFITGQIINIDGGHFMD